MAEKIWLSNEHFTSIDYNDMKNMLKNTHTYTQAFIHK